MKLTTPTTVKKKRNDGTHSVISYKRQKQQGKMYYSRKMALHFLLFLLLMHATMMSQ